MQATKDQEHPDEYLAAQAAAGDETAFATLYERYFDGAYDLAVRSVKRPDLAASVVEGAFIKAWNGIKRGGTGKNLKVWLYSIARKEAIDRAPRSPRNVADGAPPDFAGRRPGFAQLDAAVPPRVQGALEDQELVDTVWNAAAAFSAKQYTLLDIHLRRRITADELSEGLRVTKSNIYTMLSRLRGSLAESVTYTLLVRRGRTECRELAYTLTQIQGSPYSEKAKRVVHRHVRMCNRCQANRRQQVSPLDVFAGLAVVPAPPGVKGSIWQRVTSYTRGTADPRHRAVPAPPIGGAIPALPMNFNPKLAAVIAGVAVLVVFLILGTLLFTSGGGSSADALDPSDVRSSGHEPGEPSSDNTIEIEWTAVEGAKAYSVLWSEGPEDLPDTEPDLPGSATGTTSPSLDPGTWYFHLRTQGENGRWTATVHAGPFEIIEDESDRTPSPTATPAGSPTATPTAVPIPRFPPVVPPPAPPTPAPTPPPTPEPTPAPTPPPDTPPPATPTPGPASATPATPTPTP